MKEEEVRQFFEDNNLPIDGIVKNKPDGIDEHQIRAACKKFLDMPISCLSKPYIRLVPSYIHRTAKLIHGEREKIRAKRLDREDKTILKLQRQRSWLAYKVAKYRDKALTAQIKAGNARTALFVVSLISALAWLALAVCQVIEKYPEVLRLWH